MKMRVIVFVGVPPSVVWLADLFEENVIGCELARYGNNNFGMMIRPSMMMLSNRLKHVTSELCRVVVRSI